jgi:hypothetical protein
VSEEKYRTILDSIDQGFCVIEVLFDDADNAMDFRFLEVNRVFEKQTGIANAVGRWIREIPGSTTSTRSESAGPSSGTSQSSSTTSPSASGPKRCCAAFRQNCAKPSIPRASA